MRVGVDFDNTIVDYGDLFLRAAKRQGLILPGTSLDRTGIRDWLRSSGREDDWTALQGYVYGVAIEEAGPYPGVLEFLGRARSLEVETWIVSLKTVRPARGAPHDLRRAALAWLEREGFTSGDGGSLVPASRIHFEDSRDTKLARIRELDLDLFVDDLPEFLASPGFPSRTRPVLFDPLGRFAGVLGMDRATLWREIERWLPQGSRG